MISWIKGHSDITKFLLENHADPEINLENGVTALYLAAKYGDHVSLDYILQWNNEIEVTWDNSKSTPLIAAVHKGNYEWVKKLLINKAKLNLWNALGEDIYILASQLSKHRSIQINNHPLYF